MLKMTVRLEDKAGETVGQFDIELPTGTPKPGIDFAAIVATEAYIQGQGKPLEYTKELNIEVKVTHDSQDDEVMKMLRDILEQAAGSNATAASETTN